MGGYGVYVWGAYALTLTAMGGEVALLMWRRKMLLDTVENAAFRAGLGERP